ncbi:hypothetical protein FGU71_00900 [Erythrobacter insulae]|uniref:Phytanoyl-CoA dioxygenase family protein n=1 Tax=Erythrobacter insulae TaxID=2584124 RepID=A0A547P8U0_9SPHN|nr:DUF6445 family protein [Erythrobacter insulae]TRD10565.1 hypothetical protein FGU71_00900 [Erythrobacter insulae]
MPLSFLVVDDFLDNPDAFRAQALNLDYPEQEGPYPGRNSVQRLDLPGLSQYASQLVGEPLKPVEPLDSHGKCRVALKTDPRRGQVHVDPSQWSGILYLSKNGDGVSGTDFFRHKATGLERSPITDAEAVSMGYSSRDAVLNQTIEKDGNKRAAWEKTMEIPMRYNRLLLLRPWFFHTSGPGFGRSVDDGRLIYLMFFTLAQ